MLPPPVAVWHAFADGLATGTFLANLLVSLRRLAAGYAIGVGLGLLVGVAMASSSNVAAYVSGLFHAIRQVPTVAFIPMLILMFGVEDRFTIIVVAKASFYPTALATLSGVQGIARNYRDVADVCCLTPWQRFCALLLPASIPPVVAGLRLSLSRAWIALIANELLVASSGIGQMMAMGRQTFRIDLVLLGAFTIGLFGFGFDRLFRLLQYRLTAKWAQ